MRLARRLFGSSGLRALGVLSALGVTGAVHAAAQVYTVDGAHTYPSFKVSHRGISFWRGKFDKSSGKIWLDMANGTGKVDITIDTSSIDFGMPILNKEMLGATFFDVAQYPTAHYVSDSVTFKNGVPVAIDGQLTLKGHTHPVRLDIRSFKCVATFNIQTCGADARAQLDRAQFGLAEPAEGNTSQVFLYIQVEALKGDSGLPPGPPPGAPPPAGG